MRRIPAGNTVLLDTVTFVYFLERHERYYKAAKALFQRIETGDLSAVASTLVLTELLVPAYRAGEERRARHLIQVLSTFPHLEFFAVSSDIACQAARVRAEHNLRIPDSIHLATGLAQGAAWIVTNDKAFSRIKGLDLRVWLFE